MASDRQSNLQAAIRHVLADLEHLNLAGSVEYDLPKRPVARGGFGEIYRGIYKRPDGSNSKVAIKCLTVYLNGSRDTTKVFNREINAWNKVKHPNVLPLLGYIPEDTADETLVLPSLVSEWMGNGNVLEYVTCNPDCNIARLALGMAEGLAYLHDNNIVHCDFKSANVLVSSNLEPVICDFGAAHAIHDLQSRISKIRGTARWLAYELLVDPDSKPTKASDTWAFGMTLYEILTNGYPYADTLIESQVLISIMNRRFPPPPLSVASEYKKRLWRICNECWNCDPNQRPVMSEIVRRIREIKEAALTTGTILSSTVGKSTLDEAEDGKEGFAQALRSEFPFLEISVQDIRQLPDPGDTTDRFYNYNFANYLGRKVIVGRFHAFQQRELEFWGRKPNENIMNVIRALSIRGLRRHCNIQTLLGYAWNDARSVPDLVYEYTDDQGLRSYLELNPGANLVQISLEIAEGITYIHGNDIMHGDIQPDNIFMNAHGQPIIKIFHSSHCLFNPVHDDYPLSGTLRFLAPEVLAADGTMTCTKARDV